MTEDKTSPTPKELAMGVIQECLSKEDDSASIGTVADALDEAGLLMDPVDKAMFENLKLGYMTCRYQDGELQFQMTDMGKSYVAQMLIPELAKDDEDTEG